MQPTFESAKKLHELGFGIVWLKPKDKAPIKKGWQAGEREPWPSLEKSYRQGMNMGVRLGTASRIGEHYLTCLDQDVNTDDPIELEKMHRALKVFMDEFTAIKPSKVISGSSENACHYYMLSPLEFKEFVVAKSLNTVCVEKTRHGRKVRVETAAWSLTLYCRANRQMVLPPSIHPDSGREYIWDTELSDDLTLPVIPLHYLDGVNTDEVQDPSLTTTAPIDWPLRTIPEAEIKRRLPKAAVDLVMKGSTGDRSEDIFLAAQYLLRAGFTEGEACWILTNRAFGISDKPYEERGNNRVSAVEWVWKYAVRPAKERVGPSSFEVFEEVDVHPKTGLPKATLKNIILLFNRASDAGDKWIARNQFSGVDTYLGEMPWGGHKGFEPSDTDLKCAMAWLSRHRGVECGISLVDAAFTQCASANSFHPVRQYLEELRWDGTPRVSNWLSTYLGALPPLESTGLLESVSRKFLLAAVSRVMRPGCKFDYVLILGGKQGIGKSSAVRLLAGPEWAGEGKIDPDRPVDSSMLLRGKWIFEMPECLGLYKKDAESIKAFFSKEVDRGRDPYDRKPKDTPRQCVFIGTTNRDDYLTDSTGNRRFWPVEVTQCDFKGLERDRDQLWAEAYWLWESTTEELWLSPEDENVMREVQESKMQEDPWLDQIRGHLEQEDCLSLIAQDRLKIEYILSKLVGNHSQRDVSRAASVLRQLGFVRVELNVRGFRGRIWRPILAPTRTHSQQIDARRECE